MKGSDAHPGIHEVQSFEVDEYDCIRGLVCGGQTLLEASAGNPDRQLPFAEIFSDEPTHTLYSRLVDHIRTTSETISFPYRCDGETHCVYLRTVVFLSSSKRVGFLNKVTGFDARPAGVLLKRTFVTHNFDYRNCSICNRLRSDTAESDEWHEFQTLVEKELWPANDKVMQCVFDICDDCDRAVTQRMAETMRVFVRRAA